MIFSLNPFLMDCCVLFVTNVLGMALAVFSLVAVPVRLVECFRLEM